MAIWAIIVVIVAIFLLVVKGGGGGRRRRLTHGVRFTWSSTGHAIGSRGLWRSPETKLPTIRCPRSGGPMVTTEDRRKSKVFTHDFGILPIPKQLRYDPTSLSISRLTIPSAVANLYYCQPLLSEQLELSVCPTTDRRHCYACGIIFISPLGDLVRRRQLIIVLVLISASLSIGLAVTSNLAVFKALCFLIGVVTVTPQILLPLAADLAPPNRRAAAISMVLSGLLFGVLIARVLAGVIGQFTTYRVVYYMAIGVQYFVMVGCYFFLPDYPAKNDHLTYWDILWTMGKFACTEPLLIQAA
ncbi:MFS superfamily [Salix suchowensis]|nr:MFS superfamily [Salix suchowensis]